MSENVTENVTGILSSLGEPTQLEIALCLYQGSKNQAELIKILNKKFQSNISKSLTIMTYKGVIKSERQGRYVYYEIANDFVKNILELIVNKMKEKDND